MRREAAEDRSWIAPLEREYLPGAIELFAAAAFGDSLDDRSRK